MVVVVGGGGGGINNSNHKSVMAGTTGYKNVVCGYFRGRQQEAPSLKKLWEILLILIINPTLFVYCKFASSSSYLRTEICCVESRF